MTLKKIINLAKMARLDSDFKEYKLGAVIFDRHKIYAYACNTDKGLPLQRHYNKFKSKDYPYWSKHSAHAEINCLHKLLQNYYGNMPDPANLSILVYREHADGSFAMAKPCKACEHALRELGISNIYYTGNNSLIFEKYKL